MPARASNRPSKGQRKAAALDLLEAGEPLVGAEVRFTASEAPDGGEQHGTEHTGVVLEVLKPKAAIRVLHPDGYIRAWPAVAKLEGGEEACRMPPAQLEMVVRTSNLYGGSRTGRKQLDQRKLAGKGVEIWSELEHRWRPGTVVRNGDALAVQHESSAACAFDPERCSWKMGGEAEPADRHAVDATQLEVRQCRGAAVMLSPRQKSGLVHAFIKLAAASQDASRQVKVTGRGLLVTVEHLTKTRIVFVQLKVPADMSRGVDARLLQEDFMHVAYFADDRSEGEAKVDVKVQT